MAFQVIIGDLVLFSVFLTALTLLVKPLGSYIADVFENKPVPLTRIINPIENAIYFICGINPDEWMDWKQYAISLLLFNLLGIAILFLILTFQASLPLNPEGFPGFPWDLALNTAVSFVTNTNWQNYAGETAASYFTQVCGLMVQNFLSAATGICVMIALIRGLAGRPNHLIGNFWADMTRGVLYILLPLSLVFAFVLVSQGVIQNFNPYIQTTLLEPINDSNGSLITRQEIPMGPVAAQEAIKDIGTNGGGFFNANSAHPFENPSSLTDLLEIMALLSISASSTYVFGRMVSDTKQGWTLYVTMLSIFIVVLAVMYLFEMQGNPVMQRLGISGPYMEGKEVRFGIGQSVLFATATTCTSTGSVNAMHDSLTPIGGMMALMDIALGEIVFGGVGSGLYTMLAFVVIAVFVAGLMIGRIPDYLGKRIDPRDMWLSIIIIFTSTVLILIFFTIALVIPAAISSILNPGPHGLSEILYAYTSMANNNGSAFAGLNGDTLFYNITGALVMLLGRFIPAIAALALAGSFASKKHRHPTEGMLQTYGNTFSLWLIFVILLIGALSFFSAVAAGPIVEYLIMLGR